VGGNVGELREVKGLEKLGPEPFDKEFTDEYLKRIFSKTSRSIKQVLIDQEKIAGIGNIYCCEALFLAGISPTKEARALGNKDIAILRDSIIKVLREGLKYGGSSGADEQYVDLYGQKGEMQEHFNVYQRQGKKCPQCGETIRRINLGGRGTFYCPACQR
ncbi:MAG: zinc finger domain-containing protein, partial [bacterium]|nr:zinc finger domain-containing protein [bacterium]